ncbi:SAM domain-containing protein [Plasmodiophora brassicae]|uniref:SAM domain-containing protein n=1 Tax=Plasmodiophora brassicae TaxID=37360 RepID=A0A0G4J479_PLABS|nr:hypothetical protein PBRA_008896 [Plasmodiophora brassicae]
MPYYGEDDHVVGELLRPIGLEDRIELFRKADIGLDVLAKLAEPHIISLGMTKLGQRRRMLRACLQVPSRDCQIYPG